MIFADARYWLANSGTWLLTKLLGIMQHANPSSPFLKGNFGPVRDEIFDANLKVLEGELPPSLDGVFLRNGGNPFFEPVGGYHWFDGDGMVHAVRIKKRKASYCNRWVRTAKLAQEKKAGYAAVTKIGDLTGFLGLFHLMLNRLKVWCGVLSTKVWYACHPCKVAHGMSVGLGSGMRSNTVSLRVQDGLGTANTALTFHAGKLLATLESDQPYALSIVCEGLISTVGRMPIVQHEFTAHPKVDPETGEMFFFG
jgi:carotenoid cleavage dioxygenase-like enzyme